MISCKKATELMSRAMEEPLSFAEQLVLKVHLFICEACAVFARQIKVLRQVIREEKSGLEQAPDEEGLSKEAKCRISQALKGASGEKSEREDL